MRNEQDIQPTPDVTSELAQTFVRGIIIMDKRLISVIDIENIAPPAALKAA
jgi:purine-binding chemotaxis protein CheW